MERAKSKRKAEQIEITAVDKVLGNIDLLTKILNLVPPKQLIISKAVSNHWLALISDRLFLINYTRQYRKTHPPSSFSQFYYDNIPIALTGSRKVIPKIDCIGGVRKNDSFSTYYYRILHSCNGLILSKYYYHGSLFVFNPTTNKHRPLPHFAYCHQGNTVLAFDPLISFNYKVVSFNCLPFDQNGFSKSELIRQECKIDIFSSTSASWIRIFPPTPSVGVTKSKRVFWNGAIHWISDTNFHVRFDVNEENFTWNEIPTDPNTFPEGENIGYIGECDTGLLLIKFPLMFGQDCTFTVLEMKKDSVCWVPKHHVNLKKVLPEMGLSGTRETFNYKVLHVLIDTDKDCFSLVLGVHGNIILYSINNRNNHIATKKLEDFADLINGNFFPFIPCLAPV